VSRTASFTLHSSQGLKPAPADPETTG
jgi:hypothetical protein